MDKRASVRINGFEKNGVAKCEERKMKIEVENVVNGQHS